MPKRCVYPLKDTQYKYRTVFFTVPLSFSSSHTRDQRMLLLLPWRNITNPAWGAWIPSPPLYHQHMYPWCPVSYCLITKCPLCLLHPLPVSLSPSPITLGGNSGTLARHGLWLLTMALHTFFLHTVLYMVSVAFDFAPAWCGLLPKTLHSLYLPHCVTWLH